MDQPENTYKRIGGTHFITGEKPGGMEAVVYADGQGSVTAYVIIDISKQGPPGHAHGGSLIALLDEAMGAACWSVGHRAVAVHLRFDLKKAVPLNTEIRIIGQVVRQEGRKVFTRSKILLPDDAVAVEGEGIFVEVPYLAGQDGDFNPFTPLENI